MKGVTLFKKSGRRPDEPPKFTVNTSKLKLYSPNKVIFQFIAYHCDPRQTSLNPPPMLLIWRWIYFCPGQLTHVGISL